MNWNLDHATNKKIFIINNTGVGAIKDNSAISFLFRHAPPVVRFVQTYVG